MFGLDTGVIAGALKFLGQDLKANDRALEWIVSSLMLGAAAGSLLAIPLSHHRGRRGAMFYAGLLFLLGTALCSLTSSIPVMILGRVYLGLGVGFASFSAPLYIAEITEKSRRGKMISMYQLVITAGMLLALLSDSLLSYGGTGAGCWVFWQSLRWCSFSQRCRCRIRHVGWPCVGGGKKRILFFSRFADRSNGQRKN